MISQEGLPVIIIERDARVLFSLWGGGKSVGEVSLVIP